MTRPWLALAALLATLGASDPSRGEPAPTETSRLLLAPVVFANTRIPAIDLDDLLASIRSVDAFYAEASYGRQRLAGIASPDEVADVADWTLLELEKTCFGSEIRRVARARFADAGIEFAAYDHVVLVGPFFDCAWSAMADVGGRYIWLDVSDGVPDPRLVAHEFGHNFGLEHASFLFCTDVIDGTCDDPAFAHRTEYGDRFDVMGGEGHPNVASKETLGWLDSAALPAIRSSGTYTLGPLETRGAGLRGLKLQRSPDDWLYVEFRQPIGHDAAHSAMPGIFRGAYLHVLDTRRRRTLALDATSPHVHNDDPVLPEGGVFVDPATGHRLEVTALIPETAHQAGELTVRVDLSPVEFDPPTVFLGRPLPAAVPSRFDVTVGVEDASAIVAVEVLLTDESDDSFVVASAPDPGAPGAHELDVDATALHAGHWLLHAEAADTHGARGRSEALALEIVREGDTRRPHLEVFEPTAGATFPTRDVPVVARASDTGGLWKLEIWLDDEPEPLASAVSTLVPDELAIDTTRSLTVGRHRVRVAAHDFHGNVATSNEITFDVVSAVSNREPPRLPPVLRRGALANAELRWAIEATDSDGDALEFRRPRADELPPGARFAIRDEGPGRVTGELVWEVGEPAVLDYVLPVEVSDGYHLASGKAFLRVILPDRDFDGVADREDNCVELPNGPHEGSYDRSADQQRDADADGYGDACDADFDNDGVVGGHDFLALRRSWQSRRGEPAYRPEIDHNSDGLVDARDAGFLGREMRRGQVGPSGLTCAGWVPCPP